MKQDYTGLNIIYILSSCRVNRKLFVRPDDVTVRSPAHSLFDSNYLKCSALSVKTDTVLPSKFTAVCLAGEWFSQFYNANKLNIFLAYVCVIYVYESILQDTIDKSSPTLAAFLLNF